MDNVRKHGLIPEEMYRERGKVPDDGTLDKVIFNNFMIQTWLFVGVASVDAANWCDSVAHAIVSLTCVLFWRASRSSAFDACCNRRHENYLRTAYGDSENFRGHKIAVKFW